MRKAEITDKNLVSEILVSAFIGLEDDNSINYIVKQDKKRAVRMKVLMDYLFERAIRFGEVYISDNNQACILLKFTGRERITFRSVLLDLKLAFKCIGIERVFGVLKRQRLIKKNYPKEPYISPMIMGVKKESKGNGTAARLMIEIYNIYKNTSFPVYLDAASEKNVELYKKFKFKVVKKEESLGFPIYFLRLN